MNTSYALGYAEEPPGRAMSADSVLDDVTLVERYVREIKLTHVQRRTLLALEGEPILLSVAQKLSEVEPSRQRHHDLYCSLRTNEERIQVRTFLHFVFLVNHHKAFMEGEQGDRYRKEYRRDLVVRTR